MDNEDDEFASFTRIDIVALAAIAGAVLGIRRKRDALLTSQEALDEPWGVPGMRPMRYGPALWLAPNSDPRAFELGVDPAADPLLWRESLSSQCCSRRA